MRRLLAVLIAAIALAVAPMAAGHGGHPGLKGAACSPDADLLDFSDALDKTTFEGTTVGGLSGLTATHRGYRAIVDNQGTTNARFYDLRLGSPGDLRPEIKRVTTFLKPDGMPHTGQTFDGEGVQQLRDGSLLASSETEPSIRRFAADGRELGELPVPSRFRVTPAGEASLNLTFEGLGLSPGQRTLWAGMEGPLAPDGLTPEGGARVRFLRYAATGDGEFEPAAQVGYVTDPGLGVTEVQVVGRDELLVLERGFRGGVGNTVRVYEAFLKGADDVTDEPTLARDGLRLVAKRQLLDLADCPPSGATNPGTQPNPLLDNVEGMALGGPRPGGGRSLLLISDDNFGAGQVTRVYSLRVRLRGAPVLLARGFYDATKLQPGPTSGQTGVAPANGQTPPFPGQPVPGFSGALRADGQSWWGMPDNGFGAKGNSADFLLRMYHVRPRYRTAFGGPGRLELDGFMSLRDPDHRVPFRIVNESTADRLLTGGDFDIESVQRDRRGDLWFGDEFGPFLLHTSPTGRVLEAPIPLPGVKSPQFPGVTDPEINLRASNGFEAMAASRDSRTLHPILEGPLAGEDPTIRHIYEFDAEHGRYTGRHWEIHVAAADLLIGDGQVLDGRRLLLIERDNGQGATARVKRLIEVDLDAPPASDGTQPRRTVLDLLYIRDPFGISTNRPPGAFGVGDPFSFPLQSVETVLPLGGDELLVVNDNNFPGNAGRVTGRPDDIEAIVLHAPGMGGG
jgi:hypothetical protein